MTGNKLCGKVWDSQWVREGEREREKREEGEQSLSPTRFTHFIRSSSDE